MKVPFELTYFQWIQSYRLRFAFSLFQSTGSDSVGRFHLKKREKRKQNENKSVRTKEEEEIEEEDTNKNLGKKGESYRFTQSNSLEGPVGGRESCSLHLQKNTLYTI